ncbi:MAG: hypothetical protein AAF494_08985 [Pseudomonadota bacterium]
MRTLLAPIIGLLCMAATGNLEIPPAEAGEREAQIQELRKKIGEVSKQRKLEEELGLPHTGVFADLLNERRRAQTPGCRNRFERVQDVQRVEGFTIVAPNHPLLRRGPAAPERPLAIYAVDRREDGCSVMVVMGNPDDVRPLPALEAEDHRLMPADEPEN